MPEFIHSHIPLEHLLCALLLLSRLGDIGSTYLVTPTLRLEGNPIVRKLGWRFGLATFLVCLVPFYSTTFAVVILVPSLLVSAANTSKIWFARACGEQAYEELLLSVARKSRLSHALAPTLAAATFTALVGLTLLLLSPDPEQDWGYWFALGFLIYALVIALYGSLFFVRLFRRARDTAENVEGATPPADEHRGSERPRH